MFILEKKLRQIIEEEVAFVLKEELKRVKQQFKYPMGEFYIDDTIFNNLNSDATSLESEILRLYTDRSDIDDPIIRLSFSKDADSRAKDLVIDFSYRIDTEGKISPRLKNQRSPIKRVINRYLKKSIKLKKQDSYLSVRGNGSDDPLIKALTDCYGAEGFDSSYKMKSNTNVYSDEKYQTSYLNQFDISDQQLDECERMQNLVAKLNKFIDGDKSEQRRHNNLINKFYNAFITPGGEEIDGPGQGTLDIDRKVEIDINRQKKAFIHYKKFLKKHFSSGRIINDIVNFITPRLERIVEDFHNSHLSK